MLTAPLFPSLTELLNQSVTPEQEHILYPDDYQVAKNFLYSYRGSEATYNSYRREVERLIHWSWLIAKKSVTDITRDDIETYIEFCQAPPRAWVSTKRISRFISKNGTLVSNPEWRPFAVCVTKAEFKNGIRPETKQYHLSEGAVRELLAINSSFFNFLIQEGRNEINPVGQLRQKSRFIRKYQSKIVVRRLSELQWAYVLEAAHQMAERDPEFHERTLFIMTALYAMYLRISELTATQRWTPRMRDFSQDLDGNWWFTTVGKGNKSRVISVSDQMLTALRRYRMSLNLTPLPSPTDTRPLLPKNKGVGCINSTRQIRKIVQTCFDQAVANLIASDFTEEARQLESATVHWLRHTGISDDVKIRPREHVRDDAGHSSSAITDKYIDVELRARHASAKRKPLHPHEELSK